MDGENSGESACKGENLKSIRHSTHQGLCVIHVDRGDESISIRTGIKNLFCTRKTKKRNKKKKLHTTTTWKNYSTTTYQQKKKFKS